MASVSAQERSRISGARLGVTLIFLANGAGFGAWAASIPRVQQTLGLSGTELGGALLALALGAMMAMPVAGWLGTRRVPHLLSGTGLVFMLVLPWPGLAPNLVVLSMSLLLVGAAAGSMDVCMNARATGVERLAGRAIMSSFHAAWSLGALSGTGVAALASWAGAGVVGGLLAVSALLGAASLAHFVLDKRPDLAGAGGGHRIAWPGRALLGIGVLCALAFMTEGAVADWSGVYLARVGGLPLAAAPVGLAAFSAAMIFGRLTGDWVVRRFGPSRVLLVGALAAATGYGFAIAAPVAGAAGFLLVGLGMANMAPILFSAAGRAGTAASTGVSAVATLGYGGMLLGPPVIGVVADLAGLRVALALLVVAMAVMALGARRVAR